MTGIDVPEQFTLIEGTVRNADGAKHEFCIATDGFFQWGEDSFHLGAAWGLLKALESAAAEFLVNEQEWRDEQDNEG